MTMPFLHYTHRGNSHSEIRWSKFYSFWVFCIERSNHTSTEHQWPIKHSAGKSRLPSIKKFTGLQDGEDFGWVFGEGNWNSLEKIHFGKW